LIRLPTAPAHHQLEISEAFEGHKMAIMMVLPSATPGRLSGASLSAHSQG
jgi:hypothetical protein